MSDVPTGLTWQDPPAPAPRRVDVVATELRLRPGVWALIEHHDGLTLMPWWSALRNSPLFETRIVRTTAEVFGPYDVYARARIITPVGPADGAGHG